VSHVVVVCRLQRVSLDDIPDDDDEVVGCEVNQVGVERKSSGTGCLPRPSSAPAAGHMRLADKLLKLFHCTGGMAPPPQQPAACRGTARRRRGRRHLIRVVRDAQAPPPEQVADNPNIICRYSQVTTPFSSYTI